MHFLLSYLYELRHQKLRMLLTIIAVAWGMANVALMLSVGEGLYRVMETGMVGMGRNIVIVWPNQSSMTWQGIGPGRQTRITEEDIEAATHLPLIDSISGEYITWGAQVRSETQFSSRNVRGVSPVFASMRNLTPERGGRFIDSIDEEHRRRVLFLGNELRDTLFGEGTDPVGKTVWINGAPFTVIGVMQHRYQTSSYSGSDAGTCYMPAATYRAMFNRTTVNDIVFTPVSSDKSREAYESFRQLIAARKGFHPDDPTIVDCWDTQEMVASMSTILRGLQAFFGAMGAFTLIIAGVGVANIMFVTVKERTREIGIKMAVGAHPAMIVTQFLIEALLTVTIGGALGVAITIGLIDLFAYVPLPAEFSEITGRPEPVFSSLIALICVTILNIIGLFSGLFPARKASLVDPVEALRYE